MRIIKWLRASIVRQCFVVLAVIGLLAVLAAAPALILTERSTGSGGAINVSGSMRRQSYKLALAVADRVWMLENAYYSVITPESCASILFKDPQRADEAAEHLRLTAHDLYSFGVVER